MNAPRPIPSRRIGLRGHRGDQVVRLTAYLHTGRPDGPQRSSGVAAWQRTFGAATARSCTDAEAYAAKIDALEAKWRQQIGRVRGNSAIELLLELLPGVPVVTVDRAAQLIGRSEMRTGHAVKRLEAAGVLRQRNVGRQRYRAFEAPHVIDLFTGLERALASATGSTTTDRPQRLVPRRRR